MIKGDLEHCGHLRDFYKEIKELHQEHHGEEYTAVHSAILRYLPEGGVYKEIGVMQGASLACAVLYGECDKYIGVDIDLSEFKPYEHLFRKYVKSFDDVFEIIMHEGDTFSEFARTPCDILYLDSKHSNDHIELELKYHAENVSETIIIHDTKGKVAIDKWLSDNDKGWFVRENYPVNVGYTVLQRYPR